MFCMREDVYSMKLHVIFMALVRSAIAFDFVLDCDFNVLFDFDSTRVILNEHRDLMFLFCRTKFKGW